LTPEAASRVAWVVWVISWFGAAAAWRSRSVKRASAASEVGYRVPVLAGAIFMFGPPGVRASGRTALWRPDVPLAWAIVGVVACGLLLTWWARIHLGRLWSSQVTRKENHHIVDTGPYGIVRHPIYTGITLATLATAALLPTASTLAGAVLMTAGLYMKARVEERFLRRELGAEAYDAYARRVPMLVPFAPR